MNKKQMWTELAEKCDQARNKVWSLRESGECIEQAWREYQEARKLEHNAYFEYISI